MDEMFAQRSLSYSDVNPLPTLSELLGREDSNQQCQTKSQ